MIDMEQRMDNKIAESQFSAFEILGFQTKPMLAVKAGMAIGYKMALEDLEAGKFRKALEEM